MGSQSRCFAGAGLFLNKGNLLLFRRPRVLHKYVQVGDWAWVLDVLMEYEWGVSGGWEAGLHWGVSHACAGGGGVASPCTPEAQVLGNLFLPAPRSQPCPYFCSLAPSCSPRLLATLSAVPLKAPRRSPRDKPRAKTSGWNPRPQTHLVSISFPSLKMRGFLLVEPPAQRSPQHTRASSLVEGRDVVMSPARGCTQLCQNTVAKNGLQGFFCLVCSTRT